MQRRKLQNSIVISMIIIFFVGCTSITQFNATAYEKSTSIKASSLTLMDKASEPYTKHSTEIEALLLEARKAYEYAKARPKNEDATKQWEIMVDTNAHMLAGFFHKWKSDNKLSKFFIKEAKKQIGKGFDHISGLESGKIKKDEE